MTDIGKPERATQNRVITLFRDELHYRYLGEWIDRDGNSNVEERLLTTYLTKNGTATPIWCYRKLGRILTGSSTAAPSSIGVRTRSD